MSKVDCRHCGEKVDLAPGAKDALCKNCDHYINTVACPACGQPTSADDLKAVPEEDQ